MNMPARHLLSIAELAPADLLRLVDDAVAIGHGHWADRRPLAGKVVGILFRKTSTRTRTAFTVGAMKLGAEVITYGPNDLQLATGESLCDTARVLAGYLELLVIRTNESLAEMRALAAQGRMSVINALSAGEHPTQALADLVTLREALGELAGLHVLYLGEGNSTAAALAIAVAKLRGMRLTLVTPPGYGLPTPFLQQTQAQAAATGSVIEQHHDMAHLPRGVDAVYTSRWQEMGVAKPAGWRQAFDAYAVTSEVMTRVSRPQGTVFLHDLPAMRGQEVTDEVLDGPQSLAFRQAFHKLTSAMAALTWCAAS